MRPTFLIALLGLFLGPLLPSAPAQLGGLLAEVAAPAPSKDVTATLLAAQSALVPGQALTVALRLDHPEHWHTYWLNPGIGLPTTLKWDLPPDWKTTPLVWPIPHIQPADQGNQHIYQGTVYLFASVTPPPTLPLGQNFTLKASAKWLVCDEASSCNPGGASLALTLPVAAQAQPVPPIQAEFAKVTAAQARSVPAWQVSLSPKWTLTLTPGEGANPDPGEIYFFDYTKAVTTQPPVISRQGRSIVLTLQPTDEDAPDAPAGFVHASKGWLQDGSVPALTVAPAAAPPSPAAAAAPAASPPRITFAVALLSLFLAGSLLNLMPCVFPVLALKVLGFAQQAGKDPRETRRHGLAYTLGLLVFVWLVAGGMFIAKSAFHLDFAWGDLTRYSGPMAVVVLLLFVLGLNLAGLFEIGTSLGNVGGQLQDKPGYAGSFWSGALTMLISTPCSGPFMAVAMGWALQQPAFAQFFLFTSFGLGIACPYVLLSSSPQLLRKLPRPGPWMETFKQALAFPMFAAAIYFLNTFAAKTGPEGTSLLLWSLLFAALAAWIYGRSCRPAARHRLASSLAAAAALAAAAYFAWGASRQKASDSSPSAAYFTGSLAWTPWSPETLAAARAQGRPVFVDYTTLGCITCDTNEARVFKAPIGSDKVIATFKELNVLPLRAKYLADDTPADNAIRDSLKPWGISTFPAYIVYPANPSLPPFLVSDSLLSQSQVIEALHRAAAP